jgi:trehalose 6-phosphate phosphatase
MKGLRGPGTDLDAFFRDAAAAPRRALLLDYDGTLAPFRVERDQARPYAGVPDLLDGIAGSPSTRLVIVSGRAVDELLPLLGMRRPPEIWGSHGWERRLADGARVRLPVDELGLDQARAWAAREGLESRCERKPACLAIHWRDLADPAELRRRVFGAWEPLARAHRMELRDFDGGIELRARGRDKGDAVSETLQDEPSGAAAAYLGDDATDEDAFRAIDGRGLAVLVRPEPRPTLAHLWISPPEELLEFLRRWREEARAP